MENLALTDERTVHADGDKEGQFAEVYVAERVFVAHRERQDAEVVGRSLLRAAVEGLVLRIGNADLRTDGDMGARFAVALLSKATW